MRDDSTAFCGSLVTAAEGPYHTAAVGDRGALYVLTKDYAAIEVWPEGFDGAVPRDPAQRLTLWGKKLAWVRCMTYHGGYLYVTDCGLFGLMRVDTRTGHVARIAGCEVGGCRDGVANLAEFYQPWGVCVDETDGTIYVADNYNNRIRRIRKISYLINVDSDTGSGDSDHSPRSAATATSSRGGRKSDNDSDDLSPLFVVDTIAGTGKQRATNGAGRQANFNLPLGIYITPGRQLYISEQNSIRRVDLASADFHVTTEVESLSSPDRARLLKKMTQRCSRLRREPCSLISPAHPYNPHGVAVAADGSLFINDYGNHRVVQVLPETSTPSLASTPLTASALTRAALSPATPTGSLTPSLDSIPSAFDFPPAPGAAPPIPPQAVRANSQPAPGVGALVGGFKSNSHSPTSSYSPPRVLLLEPTPFSRRFDFSAQSVAPASWASESTKSASSSVEERARLVVGDGSYELRDGFGRDAAIRDPASMSFDRCHSTLYFIDAGVLRVLDVQLDNHSFMPKVFNALGQHSPLPAPMRHLVVGYLVENYKFIEGVSHER